MSWADQVLRSRLALCQGLPELPIRRSSEEGGCGVLGFACSVKIPGHHLFQPSIQMHNRGNGKGGGIAAAGLDPAFLGVSQEILDNCYLFHIAFLDNSVAAELENEFIRPFFDIVHAAPLPTLEDYRCVGLEVKPPNVKRYFVRVKSEVLESFSSGLCDGSPRDIEDEFVWQNSFKINQKYYASLGEKKAFVLSHGRNVMILKIVGYAENVIKYYKLEEMAAHVWIAHQRYPTRGHVWHPAGAHPFIGMNEALVHNGDFANYYSVAEYLKQRNMIPQFLTDTEVAAMTFDLWSRVYKYPLEYVIEGLAPTTELDFDRLPQHRQRVYGAIQAAHIHGSPDGPWFFIIARSRPDENQFQLLGITDTSMLRPQVFALCEGDVQIGLCASEKQAIDATLESISSEDSRFRPIADKYWNARGGSHTDGGAFVFNVKCNGNGGILECTNKFGEAIRAEPKRIACCFSEDYSKAGSANEEKRIAELLDQGESTGLFRMICKQISACDFRKLRWAVDRVVAHGSMGRRAAALEALTLLNDRRYDMGAKKRASVLQIIRSGIGALLGSCPELSNGSCAPSGFRKITWQGRTELRPPQQGEEVLVIDGTDFEPEGENCDARLMTRAYELGWKRFAVFNLRGQRFQACGFGAGSDGVRVDLYGSSGDYAGSGMDGCDLYVHGDAQDQLGQILKRGKMVIYGSVGQTFMYGSKGGTVYVMNNAAGRPLINAVGRPRVVINGTCLDFLAESFMAGDVLNGGGFVIVNGVEFDDKGALGDLPLPYPGSNLFSLASGGALYIRDPKNTIVDQQLNGGRITRLTKADWELIKPYLQENESLFDIKLSNLLTVDGNQLAPECVYRKIVPIQATLLAQELADEDE